MFELFRLLKEYLRVSLEVLTVAPVKKGITDAPLGHLPNSFGEGIYMNVIQLFHFYTGKLGHHREIKEGVDRKLVVRAILDCFDQKYLFNSARELKDDSVGFGVVLLTSSKDVRVYALYTTMVSTHPDIVIRVTGELEMEGQKMCAVSMCYTGEATSFVKGALVPALEKITIKNIKNELKLESAELADITV